MAFWREKSQREVAITVGLVADGRTELHPLVAVCPDSIMPHFPHLGNGNNNAPPLKADGRIQRNNSCQGFVQRYTRSMIT